MATREQTYVDQMRQLGIYEPVFDPAIKTLATMERELQRTVKAWKATGEDGAPASCDHKLYAVIQTQRKDILAMRESLGLTPKALRRVRGAFSEPDQAEASQDSPSVLELVRRRRGA